MSLHIAVWTNLHDKIGTSILMIVYAMREYNLKTSSFFANMNCRLDILHWGMEEKGILYDLTHLNESMTRTAPTWKRCTDLKGIRKYPSFLNFVTIRWSFHSSPFVRVFWPFPVESFDKINIFVVFLLQLPGELLCVVAIRVSMWNPDGLVWERNFWKMLEIAKKRVFFIISSIIELVEIKILHRIT